MFKMSLGKWQMRNMMTMQIKMVARLTSLFDELFLLLLTWAYLKKKGWIKVENQENADQRMSISTWFYFILIESLVYIWITHKNINHFWQITLPFYIFISEAIDFMKWMECYCYTLFRLIISNLFLTKVYKILLHRTWYKIIREITLLTE